MKTPEITPPLTIESLPPASTTRWVVRRKAEVVAAVRAGLITLEEACQRYTLSAEEKRTTMRTAALLRAVERVADALLTRGIYP